MVARAMEIHEGTGGGMGEPRKILREADSRMIVQLSVEELKSIVGDVLEQKLKRLSISRPGGLLNADQAAEYLGYSTDWIYKHWQKIGGKKIGGKGLRFDVADLQAWIESRNA